MDICWPQADLFNTNGNKIGRLVDGSKIAGTVKKSADALQADHILVASCDEVCRLAGSFSKTTSIQRVNTVGA
jgi:hypothetical protein